MRQNRCVRALTCIVLVVITSTARISAGAPESSNPTSWRADHHMHLASADLCKLVGECLPSNRPPAVYASDAIKALDEAGVAKGVILSCAYLYGLPSLHLSPQKIAERTRRENEFTADQISKFPTRLVGFLSVNPLQDSAIEEIRYWKGNNRLIGLKIHFTASAVNVRSAQQREKVARVLAEAAAQHLPIVVHVGGGKFNANDAELFIHDILPAAGDSWVQIAHAGGGLPREDGNNLHVLTAFADHIKKDDPVTRHVLFDLSYVPGPDENSQAASAIAAQIRRIGLKRFVFGSDFNVLTPKQEIGNLAKLGLTQGEMQTLKENCAPWACR